MDTTRCKRLDLDYFTQNVKANKATSTPSATERVLAVVDAALRGIITEQEAARELESINIEYNFKNSTTVRLPR